jgi:hypothetical protein
VTEEDAQQPRGDRVKYLILMSMFLLPASALADVDVTQTQIDGHVDPLNFGQSFTAVRDTTLTSIRLSISAASGGSDLTLRLYDFDRPSLSLGSTLLGSGKLTESQLSPTPAWMDVPLTSPASVTAGHTYAFTIQAADPGGVTGWNNYGATMTDVYAGGEFFFGLSGKVNTNTNLKELALQTITAPEPGALALLTIGSVFLQRRHRRPSAARPIA